MSNFNINSCINYIESSKAMARLIFASYGLLTSEWEVVRSNLTIAEQNAIAWSTSISHEYS